MHRDYCQAPDKVTKITLLENLKQIQPVTYKELKEKLLVG